MDGTLWMFIVFAGTLFIGVPIPIAAGIATVVGLLIAGVPLVLLAQAAYGAMEPFSVITIPLFILAGRLMEEGGLSRDLIEIANKLVGSYKGSLGLVTVVACMFFSALSGSSPATTAAIGSVTIPSMLRQKYSRQFAAAVAAASGALGSMIPPSNLLVIYGIVSETSIPRLFLAGLVPGLLLGALLLVVTWAIVTRKGYGSERTPFSWRPLLWAVWQGKWAIGAPLIILGGIYAGVFTPTEAAGVAVFYGLFVGALVYRRLGPKEIYSSLRYTAVIAGAMIIILGPTKAFGQLITIFDTPLAIEQSILRLTESPLLVLMVISLLYIVAGMFIESLPQIVIFTPLLLPAVTRLGVDPILFGVLTVMTCEIGFLTPPVGVNLFVGARLANVSIEGVSVAVLPFLIAYVIGIVLISAYPAIVLSLPNLAFGTSS